MSEVRSTVRVMVCGNGLGSALLSINSILFDMTCMKSTIEVVDASVLPLRRTIKRFCDNMSIRRTVYTLPPPGFSYPLPKVSVVMVFSSKPTSDFSYESVKRMLHDGKQVLWFSGGHGFINVFNESAFNKPMAMVP